MNRASSSRSSSLGAPADHSERFAGRCSLIVARARCSALLAAATLVSSSVAVSLAGQPSTSRAISAARCRGGSTCIAARNASSMVSRSTTTASGSSLGRRDLVEQLVRIRLEPRHLGERSASCVRRRDRARSMSRQTLVAIRYSQARNIVLPSKLSRLRQARRNVSCTASSASSNEASIR